MQTMTIDSILWGFLKPHMLIAIYFWPIFNIFLNWWEKFNTFYIYLPNYPDIDLLIQAILKIAAGGRAKKFQSKLIFLNQC